ncbi:uncharacterized protein LOC108113965 isoform X3 [Drosophila eugracilis]|uniref:uncharacterized protein LOC108113965 isoform X3 n=1 Tax=Drosophila eugracilis TaxID=29029 RepID=UPI0007E73FDE|nr:uncharacterized protein LOC108113965 isoform X3 [Drosophila eugracilis]
MNARLILRQLPNHLIFRILHYSLISQQLRDELGVSAGSSRLKRSENKALEWQPFVLWLANLLLNYSGDILGNMLLGSLPLEPLCNTADIFLSSLICIFTQVGTAYFTAPLTWGTPWPTQWPSAS